MKSRVYLKTFIFVYHNRGLLEPALHEASFDAFLFNGCHRCDWIFPIKITGDSRGQSKYFRHDPLFNRKRNGVLV